nr:uncharacterized protein [Tanacetum cinerariifolium]
IVAGEGIPYEPSPATFRQRQVTGERNPQRQVAGESPRLSLGKAVNYAKCFLHPDILAPYDYIFIWDDDLGSDDFEDEKSERTTRAPNRICLNIEVEDDEVRDLGEPANYKSAMLDPDKVHCLTPRVPKIKCARALLSTQTGKFTPNRSIHSILAYSTGTSGQEINGL